MFSSLFSLPHGSLDSTDAAVQSPHCALPRHDTAFIAGPENALVRVLAGAVECDALAFNPIVLYGPTGVGKSSVAHALANRRRQRFNLPSVISTTAADLIRGLAHALETASTSDFRARHQRCDLLLVDDAHGLAKKPAAQQFLLSTLDALLRRGSLVIVTLRQPPRATPGFSPALISRLSGGLVVGLSPPGYEARCEVVRQTASHLGFPFSDHQLDQLAGPGSTPARRMITAGNVRQAVLRLASGADKTADPAVDPAARHHRICLTVARHCGVTMKSLVGKSRQKSIAEARSLAMYLSRQLTGESYAAIGEHFGSRDHTTVLHACRKIAHGIECDVALRRLADELAAQIAAADCH